MIKYDMVKALLESAERETEYRENYNRELRDIEKEYGIASDRAWAYEREWRSPSKQRIWDDLKMARRLILEISKDVI